MAGTNAPVRQSFSAAGDLSALQHTLVKLSAANTVTGAGAGEKAIGVLLNAPSAAGRPAEVAMLNGGGVVEVKANGASPNIAAGDWLMGGANGVVVKSTPTNKDVVVGIANMAATADGVIIEMMPVGPMGISA